MMANTTAIAGKSNTGFFSFSGTKLGKYLQKHGHVWIINLIYSMRNEHLFIIMLVKVWKKVNLGMTNFI